MNLRAVVPLAAFAALVAVFAVGLWMQKPRDAKLDAVRPLPEFALPGVRPGAPGFAKADLGGQVALVNVFASWCPSCAVEQPMLMQLAERKIAPIYGVAWVDAPGKAAEWLDRHGNPYVRSGEDADGRLGVDLGVTGAPETFVIDKQGRIRRRFIGPITPEAWDTTLGPLVTQLQAE